MARASRALPPSGERGRHGDAPQHPAANARLVPPFPTKLVAEAIDRTSAERAADIFYRLVLLSISVVIGALWRYVADHRDLLNPDVSDEDVAAMTLLTAPSMGFYVGVVLLALLAPTVAAFGYLVIAVVALFRTRDDSTAASAPA